MRRDGVIQPSKIPWAALVVPVRKKYGALRFCVHYRALKNVTKKDVYPLTRINGRLDRLCHARYFSSMDLKSGYWQIDVDQRERQKAAFIMPDGLCEFKVIPFRLSSVPATFEPVMNIAVTGLKGQTCLVPSDDVLVFATSFEEHLQWLKAVLDTTKSF